MLLEIYKFDAEKQSHKVHQALGEVEWETIFFFMGLFMLVYGVEQAGLLSMLGQELLNFTEGDIAFTAILVLWASAIFSAIVDNIPFVATMIPLLQSMEAELGGFEAMLPIWWALSLGACLGGNGSLVGASANVMVASFAERAGHRISFLKFMKLGFPLMIATIAIAHVYVEYVYLLEKYYHACLIGCVSACQAKDKIIIETPSGKQAVFYVDVAKTDEEMQFVEDMPDDEG